METWVSKADDARRLIGRLVDEVHRGQIGRASELCDPVDIEALPVLMDAAHAADAADARIAELEAECARLRGTIQPVLDRAEADYGDMHGLHGARLAVATREDIAAIRAALAATPDAGAATGAFEDRLAREAAQDAAAEAQP